MKSRMVVFLQRELHKDLYLSLHGSTSVIVADIEDLEQELVVSFTPGEFFGEMGLFGEEHRKANLMRRSPWEFGRISYQDFNAIRHQFPDVLYALKTQVGHRLKTRPVSSRTLPL